MVRFAEDGNWFEPERGKHHPQIRRHYTFRNGQHTDFHETMDPQLM